MALQLRRGTNAQRLGLTPVEGEMIYVTDNVLVTISVTSINTGTETLSTTTPHGLSINQQIKYTGATLNGLTKDQVYYVKTAPTITDFTLSTSLGGGTLNITGTYTVPLVFAKTPCLASGAPVGTDVSPLWAGDGITVGGNPSGAILLDELRDVVITAPPNEGQFLVYDGTNWVNDNETSVDTKIETLSLTRRSDSVGESYENEVAFRLQDRLIDTRSYLTDEGGPAIEYSRSSGTAEISKTYVSGGAIGAFTVTLNNVTGLVVGDRIVGTGLTNSNGGVLITVIAGNQLTLNTAFTVQASGTYTVGSAIPFGHISMEWFGSTNDHRYRVSTTTDAFLENPANTYPGTNVLFEATRKYSKLNDGVVYVDATNDRVGVNTTSPTTGLEINGGLLQYTGTAADRPVFRYDNSTAGTTSVIRLRKNFGAGTYATNDGPAVAFQLDSDSQVLNQIGIIDIQYDSTASPNKNSTVRLRTNTADNDGGAGTFTDAAAFTPVLATLPGDLAVNGGDITTTQAIGNLFNATATTVNVGNGATTEVNLGNTGAGRVQIKSPTLDVSGTANITTTLTTPSITTLAAATLAISPSSGGAVTLTTTAADPVFINRVTANTNTTTRGLVTRINSTGTPAVGLGNTFNMETESTPGTFVVGSYIESISTAASAGVLNQFKMNFGVMSGGTAAPRMELDNAGNLQIDGNLTVSGNEIKSSSGTTAITLSGANITSTGSATFGVIDINTTTGQIDTNSGYDLTLDSDGGDVIVNDRLTVNVTLQTPSSDTVTTGNISLVTAITKFTTTNSAQTSTLPTTGASDGQFKTLVRTGTGSASMVVTVTNAGWKGGASGTITFGNQGDSACLQYVSGYGWVVIGSYDVPFA